VGQKANGSQASLSSILLQSDSQVVGKQYPSSKEIYETGGGNREIGAVTSSYVTFFAINNGGFI
jgi:hypothetical protein